MSEYVTWSPQMSGCQFEYKPVGSMSIQMCKKKKKKKTPEKNIILPDFSILK